MRSAFAHVHAHACGTYDLEEAAPRPAEHPLGRAAYRSRSASRVVAAHEVGVATGRSDGTDGPDGDRGRDEEKRTGDGFFFTLRLHLPPCSSTVRTVRTSDAKGPSSVNYCPSPPMPFVRPSVRTSPGLWTGWPLADASISFGRPDGRTQDTMVGDTAPRRLPPAARSRPFLALPAADESP